jgi:hypothetical protein
MEITLVLLRRWGSVGRALTGECGDEEMNRGTVVPRLVCALVAALSLAALPAVGGDLDGWSRVQRLHAGRMIAIDVSDQRHRECRFVSASEAELTCEASARITVGKDSVVVVSEAPRLSRAMRTLLGAAIGLGGGAIVNATLGRYFSNEGHDVTAVTLGSGTGAGAVIGAVSGGRYKTIYRRP